MDYAQLSDFELLAQVVGESAAKRMYRGSLASLFVLQPDASPEHLRLAAAGELLRRALREELKRTNVFQSPTVVRDYLRHAFANEDREVFVVLFLDTQHRLIEAEVMFRGTLTQTAVYPREVVKRALSTNAAAVIFAHNHPSGVAEPSRADESLTSALKSALVLVDVSVLDHFIVGSGTVTSFAERGLL